MARNITDYLEETSRRLPDKVAYGDTKRELTFDQLRTEARHVAAGLIELDLFKSPVIIYLEKSVETIASFFGTAYSGNFYTPIDTTMPEARIEKIRQTLEPQAVITDGEHKEEAGARFPGCPVLIYEELQQGSLDEKKISRVAGKVIDTDILYVLFTSGSTGTPKGVIIPHCSAIDYIDWITDEFEIDEECVLGNQAPLYFDLSIQDVYAPIKSGCTTQLLPGEMFMFPKKLMNYLVEKGVNVIVWVPTALCLMANLKAFRLKNLPDLKLVLFCGEVMPNKQLNIWRAAYPDTLFVNMYGPTEACDASTFYVVDREFSDEESLPIGKPCTNTDVLVLNDKDQLVAGDEVGELCIRGLSLACGYYNDPVKTAEAFVQNPLNNKYPERIYRTGDLVKYNTRGELEYVSRKDFQIKHLGYRIELGEIETAISSIDGVDLNCCLYDTKKKQIVLFYTGEAEEHEVSEKVKAIVPDYMVPGKKVHLDEMPRNLNGKIDRNTLKSLI